MVRGPVVRVEEKCCSLGDMLVNSFLLGDGTDMIRLLFDQAHAVAAQTLLP